ncbi:MAG: hypothetical protein CW691_05130 [Candidatus Bathyarchaeum sp.]|nr:MAG: hypothetical protein CW691_05130 [Candidatus Bathyarchaeum sp.]
MLEFAKVANAEPAVVYFVEMPEEHIEYTVCWVNGSLWAKVDGTYPMNKFGIEIQNQSYTNDSRWFTSEGDAIVMAYPTPPGTTNISIKMDETELDWSNYTQTVPEAVHYTAIGDWPMIACTIHPVRDQFTLKIHYEHPITQNNGFYTILYDLNISPYLSPWSNKSAAHFNITFESDITELQAVTIAADETTMPVEYTVKNGTTQTVSLQVVSKYAQPLPGDLLITFNEEKEPKQTNSVLGASLLTGQSFSIVVVAGIMIVVLAGYLFLKHKKRRA